MLFEKRTRFLANAGPIRLCLLDLPDDVRQFGWIVRLNEEPGCPMGNEFAHRRQIAGHHDGAAVYGLQQNVRYSVTVAGLWIDPARKRADVSSGEAFPQSGVGYKRLQAEPVGQVETVDLTLKGVVLFAFPEDCALQVYPLLDQQGAGGNQRVESLLWNEPARRDDA